MAHKFDKLIFLDENKCDHCGKKFKNGQGLASHKRSLARSARRRRKGIPVLGEDLTVLRRLALAKVGIEELVRSFTAQIAAIRTHLTNIEITLK